MRQRDGEAGAAGRQAEGGTEPGAPVRGRVLDVNKRDGIVDLTLLPRLAGGEAAAARQAAAEMAVRAGGRERACLQPCHACWV